MKFFYAPGACSIGIHVVLEETGAPFEPVALDFKNNQQHTPEYKAVNPKSKVPFLVRDDGSTVSEFPVIAWWLGKSFPAANLLPGGAEGELRALEAMDYICGTVHPQGFTRQFRPSRFTHRPEDEPRVIEQGRELARGYFDVIAAGWPQGSTWWLPFGYSVADAALFFVEWWATTRSKIDLPGPLTAHYAAMMARPAVKRALAREGFPA
ncbi:MAG: glutathione S-transferase family protein [Acetobacteraceae bacterium]